MMIFQGLPIEQACLTTSQHSDIDELLYRIDTGLLEHMISLSQHEDRDGKIKEKEKIAEKRRELERFDCDTPFHEFYNLCQVLTRDAGSAGGVGLNSLAVSALLATKEFLIYRIVESRVAAASAFDQKWQLCTNMLCQSDLEKLSLPDTGLQGMAMREESQKRLDDLLTEVRKLGVSELRVSEALTNIGHLIQLGMPRDYREAAKYAGEFRKAVMDTVLGNCSDMQKIIDSTLFRDEDPEIMERCAATIQLGEIAMRLSHLIPHNDLFARTYDIDIREDRTEIADLLQGELLQLRYDDFPIREQLCRTLTSYARIDLELAEIYGDLIAKAIAKDNTIDPDIREVLGKRRFMTVLDRDIAFVDREGLDAIDMYRPGSGLDEGGLVMKTTYVFCSPRPKVHEKMIGTNAGKIVCCEVKEVVDVYAPESTGVDTLSAISHVTSPDHRSRELESFFAAYAIPPDRMYDTELPPKAAVQRTRQYNGWFLLNLDDENRTWFASVGTTAGSSQVYSPDSENDAHQNTLCTAVADPRMRFINAGELKEYLIGVSGVMRIE